MAVKKKDSSKPDPSRRDHFADSGDVFERYITVKPKLKDKDKPKAKWWRRSH